MPGKGGPLPGGRKVGFMKEILKSDPKASKAMRMHTCMFARLEAHMHARMHASRWFRGALCTQRVHAHMHARMPGNPHMHAYMHGAAHLHVHILSHA